MALFNFSKQPEPQKVEIRGQEFSTPFMTVGKGDLTKPYINSTFTSAGVVYFNTDNLYPQLLDQMYYTSPLHAAIIDFKVDAVVGGGYKLDENLTGMEKVDYKAFIKRNKIPKLLPLLERDVTIHNRRHLLLTFSDSGKFLRAERIDPSFIRYTLDGNYAYSTDWSTNRNRVPFKKFKRELVGKENQMILTDQILGPGQDIYPLPGYQSALNWLYLDGEQSVLHKSNIQNSIFPSLLIRRPKRFSSKKEIQDFKDGVSTKTGANNSGQVMVLSGDGFENTPEAMAIQGSSNDNLFTETSKEIKDQTCFAHKINPAIMGIKVAGSLGNSEELEMSNAIYEKNTILPSRERLINFMEEFLQIADVKGGFDLHEFEIVDKQVEGEDAADAVISKSAEEKEEDARAQLRGSVGGIQALISIQQSVAAGTTDRNSAIAMLQIIYGFDFNEAKRMLGDVEEGSVPTTTKTTV